MQHLNHFDDYIQKHKKQSMHPKLNTLYSKFPTSVHKLKNLIFYGPVGVGKYTQVLSCIRKYSPSELKYEKKLTINYDKEQYLIKMSDVHFEVDMSLLGCNAKLLWNEIYTQIIDVVVSSLSHNQVGIIVCTNFHKINSELLDNFYSYMQGINSKRFKYIIITEHIGFIPDNILNNCKTIHVPKPSITNYNKCVIKNNEYGGLKVKNNYVKASNNQRLFFVKYSSAPANFSVTPKLTPSMQVDPNIGWDGSYGVEGKDAEVGVYTYQLFIKIPTFDERKMILGHVNLIR